VHVVSNSTRPGIGATSGDWRGGGGAGPRGRQAGCGAVALPYRAVCGWCGSVRYRDGPRHPPHFPPTARYGSARRPWLAARPTVPVAAVPKRHDDGRSRHSSPPPLAQSWSHEHARPTNNATEPESGLPALRPHPHHRLGPLPRRAPVPLRRVRQDVQYVHRHAPRLPEEARPVGPVLQVRTPQHDGPANRGRARPSSGHVVPLAAPPARRGAGGHLPAGMGTAHGHAPSGRAGRGQRDPVLPLRERQPGPGPAAPPLARLWLLLRGASRVGRPGAGRIRASAGHHDGPSSARPGPAGTGAPSPARPAGDPRIAPRSHARGGPAGPGDGRGVPPGRCGRSGVPGSPPARAAAEGLARPFPGRGHPLPAQLPDLVRQPRRGRQPRYVPPVNLARTSNSSSRSLAARSKFMARAASFIWSSRIRAHCSRSTSSA
jgi:hypothetical protein